MTGPDTALIGATGFVGSTLARGRHFGALYHSRNIDEIHGRSFEAVVCAAAPSLKWFSNAHPQADAAQVGRLMRSLDRVRAGTFILVSTIEVYADKSGVDEDTPVDEAQLEPYGRHRRELERFVSERFADTTIVRLPGVYGPGLRKNVIFDLLQRDYSHLTAAASRLQFYDVRRLWQEIETARRHGIRVLNIATEPVTLDEVVRACTGDADAPYGSAMVVHDMRTRHAAHWQRSGPYLYSRLEVLAGLSAFALDRAS